VCEDKKTASKASAKVEALRFFLEKGWGANDEQCKSEKGCRFKRCGRFVRMCGSFRDILQSSGRRR
jgi:hypothetical protein